MQKLNNIRLRGIVRKNLKKNERQRNKVFSSAEISFIFYMFITNALKHSFSSHIIILLKIFCVSRRDDPTFDEALPGCHLVSSCANINDRQLQMLLTIIDTFKGRMSRDFYPRPPQFFAQLTPLGTDWHVNKGIFPIWFRFRRNNRIESSIFLFCGFKQTAKSDSAVYQWHRRARLCGGNCTCGVWLGGVNDIVGIFNM